MKASSFYTRVNGRGNAWPVFLGQQHPFYDSTSSVDLSNASYSILACSGEKYDTSRVEWEVLVDAGHHTIPFLFQNGNRLPEAIVLTHGHMDHTLGLDWLAQSHYYATGKAKRYPVYCSLLIWETICQLYPHLVKALHFKELEYGKPSLIEEVGDLEVTAFPVYHGQSAKGASMLLMNLTRDRDRKVLFTGDMLCPLLQEGDWHRLEGCSAVYLDTNNRFPYPLSNHQSFVPYDPDSAGKGKYLESWLQEMGVDSFLLPHRLDAQGCLPNYLKKWETAGKFDTSFSIVEFFQRTKNNLGFLIHYGGIEDRGHHAQEILDGPSLKLWAEKQCEVNKLSAEFEVPQVGHLQPF